MANSTEEMPDQLTCAVEITPEIVDSGGTMTLVCTVSSSPPRDLRGQSLVIRDEGGTTVVSAELTEYEGETNSTGEFTVLAPLKAGDYTWSAVFLADGGDEGPSEEIATPFGFEVKAHTTSLVVWDVPSSTVVGESFKVRVGIKCSSECRLTGLEFGVYDHEGRPVAKGSLGDEPWKGTAALYNGEIDLRAPDAEGLFEWTVKVEESDLDIAGADEALPHAAGSAAFGVRAVPRPQYVVTVEAIDGDSQSPLAGARVVMHPYRASTDDYGVAELRVAEGRYKIFVSRAKYITVGVPVDLTGDFATKVELFVEPEVVRD